MEYYDELDRMRSRRRNGGRRQAENQRRDEREYYEYGEDTLEDLALDMMDWQHGEDEWDDQRRERQGGCGESTRRTYTREYNDDTYYDASNSNSRSGKPGRPAGHAATRRNGGGGSRYAADLRNAGSSGHTGNERSQKGGKSSSGNKGTTRNAGGRGSSAKAAKRNKKKKILQLEFLILFILVAGVFFLMKKGADGYWTIAVFGVDSRDGSLEKGALSDVEMLCVIDRKTGEMKLVSVYRDTYMQIDEEGTFHKINEAYFKGGHEQAVSALERNLDLKIDDFATFNWKAVADVINILGGIDLEITGDEFKYINSFITETVNSTGIGSYQLKNAGMNHLDGVQAVAYARLRLMDTDYKRTARQRKVISLALEKAKQADFGVINNILVAVLPQISTSIGIDDLIPLAKNLGKYHLGTTDGFPFSRGEARISKRLCVVPLTLESNVAQLHQLLYGVENYQPSGTVRKISDRIAKDSGMGEVAENAPKANIGGGSGTTAPSQTRPPETSPPETSSDAATEPETTWEETTEESAEESSGQEIGPGAGPGVEEETDTPSKEEPTPGPGALEGPGANPDNTSQTESAGARPPGDSPDSNSQYGPGI